MADEKFFEFLLAAFRNMAAHLAEGGSAYIFHADTEGLNFRRAFKEAGFHISGVCIWVKNSLVLGRSPYGAIATARSSVPGATASSGCIHSCRIT